MIEACASAPHDARGGIDADVYASFEVAVGGLPNRRAEMINGITGGLRHTNAYCRVIAVGLTRLLPEQLPLWKERLIPMTSDLDNNVRIAALLTLALTARGDPNVLRILEATLGDKSKPASLRGHAAAGLAVAGSNATSSLPLLREAAEEPDDFLRANAREAILRIQSTE